MPAKAIFGVMLVIGTAACAATAGPPRDTRIDPAPRQLSHLTTRERRDLMDRAQVWHSIETAQLDLLAGPDGKGSFPFDSNVTCAFDYPKKPLNGETPKFDCTLPEGDSVKVKYGQDNGEVFSEVAATRLFWAMGFYVDRMYPVKVTCTNCPDNPFLVSTAEWHLGKPASGKTVVYDPAVIERKVKGENIEVPGYEGWSWLELDRLAGNAAGATRAQIDALKLLAAFVQHVDSKPAQQALLCQAGEARGAEHATCEAPILAIKDLGSTFAAASKVTFPKMKLESWHSVPVWKNAATCQAHLTRSFVGTLENPVISEEGRQFLASRLSLLSDKQLHDLFTAARVERRKDNIEGRQVTADDWVRVFKEKRDAIVNQRCPSGTT